MELGNLLFNSNKNQEYECPEWIVALLRDLDRRLSIAMWNKNQEEYDSPFNNTGNTYISKNKIFEVHAYRWDNYVSDDDEDDGFLEYNFKFEHRFKHSKPIIQISWYKYLGRDTTINIDCKDISNNGYIYDLIINMYNKCLEEIDLDNPKY